MNEFLLNFQWLIGLIVGFLLNQVSTSIDRKRKRKDVKLSFKKYILFIKGQLNYLSVEMERLPYTTIIDEDYKNLFIKNLENLRNEILEINKDSIPDEISNELSEVASDIQFFITAVKSSNLDESIFNQEFAPELNRAIEISKRQRENVLKVLEYAK